MAVEILPTIIPDEVASRLSPYIQTTEGVHRVINDLREDPPHGRAHTIEMLFNLKWAWEMLPSSPNWTTDYDLALRTIKLHDKGYVFVEEGILKPEEHQFGSLAIASIVDNDPRVMYAILHHTDDVLPKDAPFFCKVVRDLDRLSGLGYTGVNRLAYYLDGFPERFAEFLKQDDDMVINSKIFCESAEPRIEDYEGEARDFFKNELLKYIREDGTGQRAKSMMELMQSSMVRTVGSREYKVDPILDDLKQLFKPKILHTLQVQMQLIGGWSLGDLFKAS